jgi:hypothetical protein
LTVRAIVGLAALNVSFVAVGGALLWCARGWRSWIDLLGAVGLAYLLGTSSVTTLLTIELVAGIPFWFVTVVLTEVTLVGAALAIGLLLKRQRPGLWPPGWARPRLSLWSAVWIAAILVYFEALFRSARLEGLSEWDAWRCWTIRAKAIFYFHGLDPDVFSSPLCPGYPPGFSTLEASSFHAMGSVDVVTMHLQYWFLALGFTGAVAGLLAPRVRPLVLLPFLLLALVMPSFTDRVTDGRADLPLAYFAAAGSLLVALWIVDHEGWQLPTASVLFASALLTKREGLLLLAVVWAGAIVATWHERRFAWPRLTASALGAIVLSFPWRVWLELEAIRSGAPPGGYLSLMDHLDRFPASLWLVLRTMFQYDFWLLVTPLALVAAALAFAAGATRLPIFVTAFGVASLFGCTWAIASEPSLEITQDYGLNPVVRLVGDPTITLVVLTPLLLEQALAVRGGGPSHAAPRAVRGLPRDALPWTLLLAAALAYPMSMLFGYSGFRLPGGAPSFPTADECARSPIPGQTARVVFGYASSYTNAESLRLRARKDGFAATKIDQDGCGRLRVFVGKVSSIQEGQKLVSKARAVGLSAKLEDAQRS